MRSEGRPRTAPGPRSLSPLGSLRAFQRDAIGAFQDASREFGDTVRFRVGPWYSYLCTHPDHVKHILHDRHQNYRKSIFYEFIKPVTGLGLLTNDGDSWLRQRRLAQPAFHHRRLASFALVMTDATASMLESWRTYVERAAALDLSAELMRLTLEIVGRTLLSTDVSGESDVVGQAVSVLREHVNYRSTHLFTLPERFPTPRNLRFRRALQAMDTIVYGMIDARRRNGQEADDLLSMLLAARDEETGEGMSDKQLRDEVFTIFVAGHETTAITLSWCCYLLAQHPDAERRLHDELTQVLAGRPPTFEDLPNLPYTRMVLDETLRLYPPAWSIGRAAIEEDEVGGYRIPKNAQVTLSPYLTHRHPSFWDEPEAFAPERFAPEKAAERPRYAYFPFGGGPRQCIGNEFALIEAQLVLAMLAQRYRLRLVPGLVIEPEPSITLRPRQAIWVTAEER